MVGPFCFALKSLLAGIAGRNKLLINMKGHLQRCAFCLLSFGLGFKVQGSGLRWRLRRLFYWAMPESSILVTSRFYDTREGIGSHVWCQILRLSPHLFWLGLFSHRAFLSAQDDDTRGRKGSHLGDTLHVLGLAVLYYDMSRLLETEVPQRDFRVWLHPKRRLACPLRRLPMKPNGPRRRRRIDVPRRGTLLRNGQYGNCAKRYSVSSSEAKPWALYRTRM